MAETYFPEGFFPNLYFGEGYWRQAETSGLVACGMVLTGGLSGEFAPTVVQVPALPQIPTVGGRPGLSWPIPKTEERRPVVLVPAGMVVVADIALQAEAHAVAAVSTVLTAGCDIKVSAASDIPSINSDNTFWLLAA